MSPQFFYLLSSVIIEGLCWCGGKICVWGGKEVLYTPKIWSQSSRDYNLFEIASKYCISDSFVDYEGYSISSKGSLPTVVDIMVIWIKFALWKQFFCGSKKSCWF